MGPTVVKASIDSRHDLPPRHAAPLHVTSRHAQPRSRHARPRSHATCRRSHETCSPDHVTHTPGRVTGSRAGRHRHGLSHSDAVCEREWRFVEGVNSGRSDEDRRWCRGREGRGGRETCRST
eukprot:2194564-Rhodomonas_salina.4